MKGAGGRAKISARVGCVIRMRLYRAGFEPFRGRGLAQDAELQENVG